MTGFVKTVRLAVAVSPRGRKSVLLRTGFDGLQAVLQFRVSQSPSYDVDNGRSSRQSDETGGLNGHFNEQFFQQTETRNPPLRVLAGLPASCRRFFQPGVSGETLRLGMAARGETRRGSIRRFDPTFFLT